MMYQQLAHYYDALVKDEAATDQWVAFIERVMKHGSIMELACGSGEITIALAQRGYQMSASDLSSDMIQEAQKKPGSEKIEWHVMDMCAFDDDRMYDGILCLCDSFNYLLDDEQVVTMFQQVYAHLRTGGIFIMDMHSMDRLEEFEEEYNEAGSVNGRQYQWTIYTEEDCIYQNFAFYDDEGQVTLEQHIQRVYDPADIARRLQQVGFQLDIWTDFTHMGIQHGEKQFFICRKDTI